MKHFIRNIAFAAVAAVGLAGGASAAVINAGGNNWLGTLEDSPVINGVDLSLGAFGFGGFTNAASGGLTVNFSDLVQSAAGRLQILIQSQANATITVDTLTFGGVPLTLSAIGTGYEANFSGALPSTLSFAFSNANPGDFIQISVAAVPLPAGGLLLIGGLGALALVRRRKAAA